MGTRSTIKFYSEFKQDDDKPLVCIYQQYDGYISGVGHELAEFLKDKTLINGIGSGQEDLSKFANGMGCLAAQFIKQFKERVGGLYISDLDDSQNYNYEVRAMDDKSIQIKVNDIFTGSPEELLQLDQE